MEKLISESLIIVLYVDEAWPEDESRPGFLPKDPYGRAITHFWSDFVDKKIFDAALRTLQAKGEEKEGALKELYDNLITLESGFAKLDAKPFFNGPSGYADISLAPFVAWLPSFLELAGIRLPTVDEAPHLHDFFSAIREHPAAKVAFRDQEKLITYARMLHEQWAAST
ncbi:hypothetical protein O6H91_02G147100 [Diphasiastrum complanatum]|uniref:Uncharacterized protein n=1 Tax=Diphasiastrum complanatum TaxID=34168 RepID=A0ACC2ELW3_DIPCM|nr:hypothetical protein O6H91_02G147100 [Diphasiastrum complanatum]